MNILRMTCMLFLSLVMGGVWAASDALTSYKMLSLLEGDWMLSPESEQEGEATRKGPASKR